MELSIDSTAVIGVFIGKCNVQGGLECDGRVMEYILIILIGVLSEIIASGLMRRALYLYFYLYLYYVMFYLL
jgi:hypothetical protein